MKIWRGVEPSKFMVDIAIKCHHMVEQPWGPIGMPEKLTGLLSSEVNGTTIMLRNLPQRPHWDHWDCWEGIWRISVKWRNHKKAMIFTDSSLLAVVALWRFVLKAIVDWAFPQPQLSHHPVSLGSRRKACWTCWMAKAFMQNMYALPCFASHRFVARNFRLWKQNSANISTGHQSSSPYIANSPSTNLSTVRFPLTFSHCCLPRWFDTSRSPEVQTPPAMAVYSVSCQDFVYLPMDFRNGVVTQFQFRSRLRMETWTKKEFLQYVATNILGDQLDMKIGNSAEHAFRITVPPG